MQNSGRGKKLRILGAVHGGGVVVAATQRDELSKDKYTKKSRKRENIQRTNRISNLGGVPVGCRKGARREKDQLRKHCVGENMPKPIV